MPCVHVQTPDGVMVILCGPPARRKPCIHCGRPSSVLCDRTISKMPFRTCDQPLCEGCAQHRPGNVDYCKEHRL